MSSIRGQLRPGAHTILVEGLNRALRALLPSYVADYWGRRDELEPLLAQSEVTYVSSRDAEGKPQTIDDRALPLRIYVPTVVIAGRYDIICRPRRAHEIHDRVPGSRLTNREHSGHLGHIEEPERFAEAIENLAAV